MRKQQLLLALAIAIGAYLRFEGLGQPSYWLDEVLGQTLTTQAMGQPWWRWITGWEPEHGPLYYATQAATRLAGTDEFAGRLAAALFGLATIPLAWAAAVTASRGGDRLVGHEETSSRPRLMTLPFVSSPPQGPLIGSGPKAMPTSAPGRARLTTKSSAFAAAVLLAISPFHVYYSREARPYALVMLLTAAFLLLLLRGASLWSISAVSAAMLYTSAVAAPIVAAGAVAALFSRRRFAFVPPAIAVAAFLLLYRSAPDETPGVPFEEMGAGFFLKIIRSFTVSATGADANGRTVFALCAFAIIGAIVLVQRERRSGAIVVAMAVLPVAFTVAALKITGHWFALRYTGPGLVALLVLAAIGITSTALFIGRKPAIAIALTLGVLGVTAHETWSAARREPFQKLNWRGIAERIAQYSRPGDVVIAAEPWTGIMSDFYLARTRAAAVDIQVSIPALAEQLRREHPATFILSSNSPGDAPMRQWTCSQPLLLASPLDSFRMHFAGDFLAGRAQLPEHRAVAAGIGDEVLYRQGWAAVEGGGPDAFRWVIGERSSMIASGAVSVSVLPLDHRTLSPQRMRIAINGRVDRELTLATGWSDHVVRTPEGRMNTVTFQFARATAPATLDPRSGDTRRLAAAFRLPLEANVLTRIASAPLLDENSSWRHTRSRLTRLRRETVIPLLGRLGFDPADAWPRLERGELRLEDLVESIAYGSECEDDAAFLRNAFELLFERAPAVGERLDQPRLRFLGRLAKSDAFRHRYSYISSTSST